MIDLGFVALLRPWWLLALPLVALAFRAGGGGGRLAGWSGAVDPPLLAAMERFGYVASGRAPARRLPAAIAALTALALSGPAIRTSEAPTFRNLDGVAILIDLSRSMAEGEALAEAVAAGRLTAQASAGRPVALIVFAGDAYLASPFTTDADALGTSIAALDGETVPDQGTCLDCALGMARDLILQARMTASDVVLVSDTADPAADAAPLVAADARLSTLYAAPRASPPDMPPPDPAALAALAARGGGRAATAADPAPVLALLATPPDAAEATADIRLITHLDLGRYFLVLPALLTLGLFRRSV